MLRKNHAPILVGRKCEKNCRHNHAHILVSKKCEKSCPFDTGILPTTIVRIRQEKGYTFILHENHAPILTGKNVKKVIVSAQEYCSRPTVPNRKKKNYTRLCDAKIRLLFWQEKNAKVVIFDTGILIAAYRAYSSRKGYTFMQRKNHAPILVEMKCKKSCHFGTRILLAACCA